MAHRFQIRRFGAGVWEPVCDVGLIPATRPLEAIDLIDKRPTSHFCCSVLVRVHGGGRYRASVTQRDAPTALGVRGASVPTEGKGLRRNWAVIDSDRCLGCGVCGDVCRWDAHGMEQREARPYIPTDTMERIALMAIERGKLGDLLYDNVGSGLGRTVSHALSVIEQMAPWKAAKAVEPLRSRFLDKLVTQLRAKAPM